MGTPWGSSHAGSTTGHCEIGAVNLELGWAAFSSEEGVQLFPCQLNNLAGFCFVIPSHQISPSGVKAVFVKIEFFAIVSIALGLVSIDVPGATPKNPASGFIA